MAVASMKEQPRPPPPRTSIGTLLLVWQLKVKWAGFSLTWLIYWVQYIVFVVYIQWPQSSFPQNQLEHECYTYSNMVHSIDVLLLLGMANCLSSNFREGVRFAHHDQSWNEAKTDHPWHYLCRNLSGNFLSGILNSGDDKQILEWTKLAIYILYLISGLTA